MQRLTGMDAGFLYMETPTLHMHTLKVAVVDPRTVPGGYSFEKFHDALRDRLHLLPPFRRRLVEVPAGFHHPVWIEDPDFELRRHLKRASLPSPGGFREMDDEIARIASSQLDRSRPLWELWALEGLAGGLVAFVAKIHHAAADGVAAAALLANVMSPTPELHDPTPAERPWSPEPAPSGRALLRQALRDHVGQLLRLPSLVSRTIRALARVVRHRRQATVSPPLPFSAPRTPFNVALSPLRSFATTSLPLADFKRVKEAFGVTINDVVLAVVAETLRRFLAARDALPAKALVAGVPVSSSDPADAGRLGGNRVSSMFTSLRTDLADPIERLHAIHAVTREAKVVNSLLGTEMLEAWVQYTPPRPYAAVVRLWSRWRLGSRLRPPLNLVVSNVAGPSRPLYVAGAELKHIFSVGPVLEGIGLNLTAWSYCGQMNFGAIAAREAMPDLHEVTGGLGEALRALRAAAEAKRQSA